MDKTEEQSVTRGVETTRLLVSNIPYELTKPEFVHEMAKYGKIEEAHLSKPSTPGATPPSSRSD